MAAEDKDDYYTKTAADAEFLTSNLGVENNGKFLKVDTDGSATFDYPTADPSMVEGAIEESCTNGYISQVYSKEEKFIIPTETSELVPDSDIKDKGQGGNASYEQVGATVSWGTGKSQVHGYIDVEEGDVYDVTWKCQNSSHQNGYYTGIVLTGDDAVVKVDAVTSYPAYATTTTTRVIIPSGMNITRLYFCSTQNTTDYPTSDTRIEKITQSTTTKTIAKTKDYGNYELIEAINNAALGGATTSTVGETLSFGSETDIVHGYVNVKPNETYLVGLVYDSDDGTRGIYATDENNEILYSFNDLCIVTSRTVGKTSSSTTSGAQMPCNSIIKVVLPSDSTIKRLWVCTGINNIVYPADGFFINKWVSKDYSVYKEEMEGLSELYVGTPEIWINGASDSGGYINASTSDYRYYGRISKRDIVSYPTSCYKKLTIHLTKGFVVAFRTGCRGGSLNNNCYWFKDGDTFTIPDHCNYYALTMSKIFDPGSITEAATGGRGSITSALCPMYPSDFENACLRITYEKVNNEVSSKNDDVLSNARAKRTDTSPWNQLTYYPVIAHTSDCHGDLQRVKNFFDYCDTHNIDCACVTGDIVGDRYDNRLDWFHDIVNSHSVFPAVCMGNHDVTAGQSGLTISDQDAYNNLFGGIADKVKNTTGKTWYYTDLTDKSLRVISVNLFQYGGSNRSYAHFTEEQLNWFCSTLLSTPENYGIIVLTHAPLLALQKDNNYTTFWQRLRNSDSVYQNGVTGYPIYDIVDAFISGKSDFSKTWSQTGEPSSVSVTADFSGKNTGVEFIAHLTGHLHEDSICYVPTTSERTQKQLMLNVITTNSMYGGTGYHWLTDCSDCARDCCTESGNAFNVYVIDRDTKKVKIVRIGNNIIEGMAERKYMEIPYAD